MTKYLHDTHFHLDLYDNIPKIVEDIEKESYYVIAVTNLPPLYQKMNKIIKSKYINVALGFHPELVTQYKKYIPEMWRYLNNERYIGEVGLDLKNKSPSDCENQTQFFKELIYRCNSIGDKILSIHSRGSEKEVLSLIGDTFNGKIILHWYSGSLRHLENAIKKGYYFSINYSMLQSSNGRKIIKKIPRNKLLIESDAPFVKINNYPYGLKITIQELGKLICIDSEEMENILSHNFESLLKY